MGAILKKSKVRIWFWYSSSIETTKLKNIIQYMKHILSNILIHYVKNLGLFILFLDGIFQEYVFSLANREKSEAKRLISNHIDRYYHE